MRISRVQIANFRNFRKLDIALGENAVIVGENKVGKSKLLFALRLLMDPSLPDTARHLEEEDFWDGLPVSQGVAPVFGQYSGRLCPLPSEQLTTGRVRAATAIESDSAAIGSDWCKPVRATEETAEPFGISF